MPWATLIMGCLAGAAFLTVMAHLADVYHQPLDQGTVRLAFLPAVAALAFVLRAPFRPLTLATPVPAWVTPVGHLLLAVPVLAATCWAQLRIVVCTIPPHTLGHPPAVYPVIAQLTGWCAVTVAAAAGAAPVTPTSAEPSPSRSASRPSPLPGTRPSPAESWCSRPPPRTA